jgi:hypothetical protein
MIRKIYSYEIKKEYDGQKDIVFYEHSHNNYTSDNFPMARCPNDSSDPRTFSIKDYPFNMSPLHDDVYGLEFTPEAMLRSKYGKYYE